MGQPKGGGGVNPKGRNRARGRFVYLSFAMVTSPAWRGVSHAAKAYFVELKSRYNGSNNGRLRVSCEEAARLLGMSKTTAARAQRELIAAGFLELIRPGGFYQRIAAEYRVTDEAWTSDDGTRNAATNDWRAKT